MVTESTLLTVRFVVFRGGLVNPEWFYSDGDQRMGPVTIEQLREFASSGTLKRADLVWKDGMPDWVEARTIADLFPSKLSTNEDADPPEEKPSRRVWDRLEERQQARRSRDDDQDADDDRPSRQRSRGSDRPANQYDDERDDYDDSRRSRSGREQKPGQIQTVGILFLVGGILGILISIGYGTTLICCLWPGVWFELVMSILLIIRGTNMMNADDQGPPTALAVCQICFILNGDVVNLILGIVAMVMINSVEAQQYYRRRGFM